MATANNGVSESEFFMWRAVFAFSVVDNMLSMEEQQLLQVYLKSVPFSDAQRKAIQNDFSRPQDVEALYKKITESRHRERFCVLARALVWCEGDMIRQEEAILKKLSCLGNGADDDVLRRTRHHPHIHDYYQHYARAGVIGMAKTSPLVERRI